MKNGWTPLMVASSMGDLPMSQVLLNYGPQVDLQDNVRVGHTLHCLNMCDLVRWCHRMEGPLCFMHPIVGTCLL